MASYSASAPQPTLPRTGSSVTAASLVQIRTRLVTGLPDGYRCMVLEVSSGKTTLKSSLWTVNKGDVFCEFWARLQYPVDGKIEVKVTPTAPLGRYKLFYRVRDHAVYATLDLQADAVDAAEAQQGRGHEGAGGAWRSVTLPLHTRTLGDLILGHHQEAAPVAAHLQMDYCVLTMPVALSRLPELELLCPLARPLHSYAHGGFMGAALSMLADPQWATILIETIGEEDAKMLGYIQELTNLRDSGNTFARREMLPLMLILENSPLLCAYGLVRSGCTKPPSEAAVLASSTVHLLAGPPYNWQAFDLPPSCIPRMLQPLLALQQQEQLQQPLGTGPNFNRYGYSPLGLEWDLWLSPDNPADLSQAVVDHGSAGDLVQQAIAMALRCHAVAKSMGRRHNRMHGINPSRWLVDFATALNLAVTGRAQHPLPLWGPPRGGAIGAPLISYEDGAACPTLQSYLRVGIASLRIRPPRRPYTSAAAASFDLPNVEWLAVRVKVVGNTHTHNPLWLRKFAEAELERADAPPAVAGVKAAKIGAAASPAAAASDRAGLSPAKRAKEYICADLGGLPAALAQEGSAASHDGTSCGFGSATLYPVESGDLGRSFVLLEVYNMFVSPSPVARAVVPLHALEGLPRGTITLTSVLRPRKHVRAFKNGGLDKVAMGNPAGGNMAALEINPAATPLPAPPPPAPPPPAPPPPPPVPPAPSPPPPPIEMPQHPLPQEPQTARQLGEVEYQRLSPHSLRNRHTSASGHVHVHVHGPPQQRNGQQHRTSILPLQPLEENGPAGSAPPPPQRMWRSGHGTCPRFGYHIESIEADEHEAACNPGVIGTSRRELAAPGPVGESTESRPPNLRWGLHSRVSHLSDSTGPGVSRSVTLGSDVREGLMPPAFRGAPGAAVGMPPGTAPPTPQRPPVSRGSSMPHVSSSSMSKRLEQMRTMPRLQQNCTLPVLLKRGSLGLKDIAELELQRDAGNHRFSTDGHGGNAGSEGGVQGADELNSDAEEDDVEGEYEDVEEEEGIPSAGDVAAAGGVAAVDLSHVVISCAVGGGFVPHGRGAVILTLHWETLTVLQAAQQLYNLPPHVAQSCTAMMSSPGGLFLDIKSGYSKAAHLRSFASTLAGIGVHVKAICSFVPKQIDFGDQPRPSDPKPAIATAGAAEGVPSAPPTAAAAAEPAPAAADGTSAAVAREVALNGHYAAPIQVPTAAPPSQGVAGMGSGMLSKLMGPGPRSFDAVLFFHGLNGLQLACEAGRVAPGTCVLFNGASMLLEDPGAAIAPPPRPSKAGEQAQVGEAAEGEVNAADQAIEGTQEVSLEGGDKEPEAEDNSNGRCGDAQAITASRVHSCSGALMGPDVSNQLENPAAKGQPTIEAARLPFGAEASASGTGDIREGSKAGSASESGSPAKMCAEVSKRGSSGLFAAADNLPALLDREAWLRYITVVDIFKIYGGIYVQEPDCCPAAVDALIQLTNKNPGLLPLGFAYGHLGSKAVAVAGHVGRGLAAQQILEELSSRKALSDKVRQWITEGVHVGASDQVYLSWGRRLLTGTETLWMHGQELLLRLLADYDCGATNLLDEGVDLLRLLDGLGGFKFVFSRFHKHYEATSPFTFLEAGFNFNYTKALLRLLRNRGALAAMALSEKVDTAIWLATDSSLRLWVQRCLLRVGRHKHIKEALVCLVESSTQQEFEEICKALGGFCALCRAIQGWSRAFGRTYLKRIRCAQGHWTGGHANSSLIIDGACTHGFIRYARRLPGGGVALGQGLEEAIAATQGWAVVGGTGNASSSEVAAGIGEEAGIMPATAVKWYQWRFLRQPQLPTFWLAPDGVMVTLDPRHTRDKVWMLKLWRLVRKVFCCAFTWCFQHCLCTWTCCCSFIYVCPILWHPYCRTRLLPLVLSLGAVGFWWFLIVLTIVVSVQIANAYKQMLQTEQSLPEPPYHHHHPPPSPHLDGNVSSSFSSLFPSAALPAFTPDPQ